MRNSKIKNSRPSLARGGFATTMAIILIALATMAATSLVLQFSNDVKRTSDEAINAQLRQLLIAARVQEASEKTIAAPEITFPDFHAIVAIEPSPDGQSISLTARTISTRHPREQSLVLITKLPTAAVYPDPTAPESKAPGSRP